MRRARAGCSSCMCACLHECGHVLKSASWCNDPPVHMSNAPLTPPTLPPALTPLCLHTILLLACVSSPQNAMAHQTTPQSTSSGGLRCARPIPPSPLPWLTCQGSPASSSSASRQRTKVCVWECVGVCGSVSECVGVCGSVRLAKHMQGTHQMRPLCAFLLSGSYREHARSTPRLILVLSASPFSSLTVTVCFLLFIAHHCWPLLVSLSFCSHLLHPSSSLCFPYL